MEERKKEIKGESMCSYGSFQNQSLLSDQGPRLDIISEHSQIQYD